MDQSSFATVDLHQLLDRWKASDRCAADEPLSEAGNRLERLDRTMLRGYPNVRRWVDIDDVLQNSTLRLLRTLQQLHPASIREFHGLASLHIHRELHDLARHYGGPQGIGGNHAGVAPDSPPPEVRAPHQPHAEDLEVWTSFHHAIDQLPEYEKKVVGIVFYHGWVQKKIAELLETSERTTRRRWQAACLRLRDLIGSDLPSPWYFIPYRGLHLLLIQGNCQ